MLGRGDDRAVARQVRGRAQDVHLLRARRARDALERDRRDLPPHEDGLEIGVSFGLDQRDEHRSFAQGLGLRHARRADVLGVLRLKQSQLDLQYARRWAKHFRVEDLLDRALAAAKA